MSKKYIKGKDGKFKGSIADPKSIPTSRPTKLPVAPSLTMSDEDMHKTNNLKVIYEKANPQQLKKLDFTSEVIKNSDNKFEATIEYQSPGAWELVVSKSFNSEDSAKEWLNEETERISELSDAFDQEWETNKVSLSQEAYEDIAEGKTVLGNIDRTFGTPTAWLRNPWQNKGATVQKLGNGFLVSSFEFTSEYDTEGRTYLYRNFDTFEEAFAFSYYTCTRDTGI